MKWCTLVRAAARSGRAAAPKVTGSGVLPHQRPAGDRRDDRVTAVAQVGVVVRLATARVRVRAGVRCGCSFS